MTTKGELVEVADGIVAQVPDANVVLAGAMASFGVVPAAFGGDPSRWAERLDVVLGWGAAVVRDHRFHESNGERAAMLTAGDLSPPPSILSPMGLT